MMQSASTFICPRPEQEQANKHSKRVDFLCFKIHLLVSNLIFSFKDFSVLVIIVFTFHKAIRETTIWL